MNMGSRVVALAMAIMVMRWSVVQRVEAVGPVTCLNLAPHGAPLAAANQWVQYLRSFPEPDSQCTSPQATDCQDFWYAGGDYNAAGTICAGPSYCIYGQVWGDYQNEIIAQCINENNEVQGVYELSDGKKFFLTAKDCLPNCINP